LYFIFKRNELPILGTYLLILASIKKIYCVKISEASVTHYKPNTNVIASLNPERKENIKYTVLCAHILVLRIHWVAYTQVYHILGILDWTTEITLNFRDCPTRNL